MIGVQLRPVDTWFFRDGVPFTRDSAPQENVASLFPPHPPTVVGALRAALARARGWDGSGRWPDEFDSMLGNGPDDMGKMCVDGPFLLRCGQPLFHAPRHLLGSADGDGWSPRAFLAPGDEIESDLGHVRLPHLVGSHSESESLKPGVESWLTPVGMNAALRGETPGPNVVVSRRHLWASEPRTGLKRADATRTAAEGMLYSTQHVRPSAGVTLGARIRGLSDDWGLPSHAMVPLGGEGRLAEWDEWDGELGIEALPERIRQDGKVALITLSPLDLDREIYTGKSVLDGLGAKVVSACLDRPQRIGGWDSRPPRPGHPLPIRSVLPPGSVLFCELFDRRLPDAAKDGLARIGARTEWGFGLVALGVWPEG